MVGGELTMDEILSHLDARARSYPLRSWSAYEGTTGELTPELRQGVLAEISAHGRGRTDDTARLVVERAWGSPGHGPALPLGQHISAWADGLLVGHGHGHALRRGANLAGDEVSHSEAALRWRWASLFVPKALLIGAATDPAADGHLILATPTLERVLTERPWAEIHIHAGATSDFDTWWVERLVSPDRRQAQERGVLTKLRAAALLRLVLHACIGLGLTPEELLVQCPCSGGARRTVSTWLAAVLGGAVPSETGPLDAYFGAFAGPLGYCPRRYEGGGLLGPPRPGRVYRPPPNAYAQEVSLVRSFYALARRGSSLGEIESLRKLFWQYQRLRTFFFSRLVQTPGIGGLRHFQTKFREIKSVGHLREGLFERALRVEARGLDLRALEVRPSVPEPGQLIAGLKSWALSAWRSVEASGGEIEMGLVVSLIKPSNPDEVRPRPGVVRFASRITKLASQVDTLVSLLHRVPELLILLRGVDVASLEMGAPTWAVAPFMKRLREGSRKVAFLLASRSAGNQAGAGAIPPLRMTAHAGEDFLSPVEGLRRIDELIESGVLGDGDRIGHGLALGARLQGFIQKPFLQPREERLFDLIWELQLAERRRISISGQRIHAHRGEIRRLLAPFEGRALAPGFEHLPRRLLAARADELIGWARKAPSFPTGIAEFLADAAVYDLLRQPVEVTFAPQELEALEQVQLAVVRRVARHEILVEANPSSNLLIGDLQSLRNHPAFRLAPIGRAPAGAPEVAVAICDDDPITFSTCLSEEVAYVYAALRQQPDVGAQDALDWIERARLCAWRGRFTVKAGAESAQLRDLAESLGVRAPTA